MTLAPFSGDTSGSGSEDAGSLTGTLTFTDATDGDFSSELHLCC